MSIRGCRRVGGARASGTAACRGSRPGLGARRPTPSRCSSTTPTWTGPRCSLTRSSRWLRSMADSSLVGRRLTPTRATGSRRSRRISSGPCRARCPCPIPVPTVRVLPGTSAANMSRCWRCHARTGGCVETTASPIRSTLKPQPARCLLAPRRSSRNELTDLSKHRSCDHARSRFHAEPTARALRTRRRCAAVATRRDRVQRARRSHLTPPSAFGTTTRGTTSLNATEPDRVIHLTLIRLG